MASTCRALLPAFVTALDMSALRSHEDAGAVQPFIDTSISKTVNVPADYDEFKDLYAPKAGNRPFKGLATYRPIACFGAVLRRQTRRMPSP